MVLALGADLTKIGFWSQEWKTIIIGRGEAIKDGYELRSGVPLQFAKEIQTMISSDYRKAAKVGRVIELLQEEVSPKIG